MMQVLTDSQVQCVNGGLSAASVFRFGETMAAGAIGGIVAVVSSPFVTPAGGIFLGWAAGVGVSYAFGGINELIGI